MTTPNKAGIYIHIPFCVKKCNYCAFLSGPAGPEVRQEYVNHLIEEIRLRSREVLEADTIYFGGGTPSLLTPEQIGHILEEVRKAFRIAEGAEVTLEANPGTLTEESLAGYRNAGINRLSMGVQSMDDRRLRYLGRIHTAEEVRRDVKMAREAGFHNINLDLIFAIPGTDVSDALADLEAIAALEPEHISFYSLQLEEGTSFFRDFEAGKLQEVPDETDREMYHRGIQVLREKGYRHYEISNFARPGYESRHNSKYWNMAEYVGLGLGASSYTGHRRMVNETDLKAYSEMLDRGELAFMEVHENSEGDDISEAVFTGLRREEGVRYRDVLGSEEAFWEYFREALPEAREYEAGGFLEMTDEGLRLTERGIDISNGIMALFV